MGTAENATIEQIAEAAPLGEVVRDGARVGLRYERQYRHPIERVWRAITESDQFRQWMPCDMVGERREGAEITLPFGRAEVEKYQIADPVLPGRIEIWQPPSVFQWTWDTDVLRFELSKTESGTRLVFTTWPESQDPDTTANTACGYHLCFADLTALLDGDPVASAPEVDAILPAFQKRYRERLGLPAERVSQP